MADSLSILVPVRNAEGSLAAQVEDLLDVLPDLTPAFEILVVDDGSTDHTADVARELARQYPQLRLIRHAQPRGAGPTIETGLRWAQGQTVLVQDDPAALSATELRRLWSLRHRPEHARPSAPPRPGMFDAGLLERLTTWGQALRQSASGERWGGVQMLRPHAAETLGTVGIESVADVPAPAREVERRDESHAAQPQRAPGAVLLKHLHDVARGQ